MTGEQVHLRPEQPEDQPAVMAVVRAAFGEAGDKVAGLVEQMWAETGQHGSALGAALGASLVAVADDEVVGHVALTRGWMDANRRLVELAVLSPLAVRPDLQRRGIGRKLVDAAVEQAERSGAPLVLLEGDPAYYSRLGFEPALRHGLVPPSPRIPVPACQVRLLSAYEPWMTGGLVYPDVFWRLDCVGLRDG